MISKSKDTKLLIIENVLLKKIVACHDLEKLIELFIDELLLIKGIQNLFFLFHDSEKASLVYGKTKLSSDYKEMENISVGNTIPLDETSVYSKVYKTQKHSVVDYSNYHKQDHYTRYIFKIRKIKQLFVVPIFCNGESIGVLSIYNSVVFINKELKSKVCNLTRLFSSHLKTLLGASFLISREKAINCIYKRNTEVLKIAEKLNNIASPNEILKNAMCEIIKIFGFDFGVILLKEGELLKPFLIETSDKKKYKNPP